jgi:hypothetical protein
LRPFTVRHDADRKNKVEKMPVPSAPTADAFVKKFIIPILLFIKSFIGRSGFAGSFYRAGKVVRASRANLARRPNFLAPIASVAVVCPLLADLRRRHGSTIAITDDLKKPDVSY